MAYLIYNNENLKDLLKGYSIIVIGNTIGCGNCAVMKSKLEIISKNYPYVNFIFWDINEFPDLSELIPNFTPLAFPYIRSYYDSECFEGIYSSETCVIEDMIKKLKEKYVNS